MLFGLLLLVGKPISFICLPLRGIEYRKRALSFTGPSGIGISLMSSLEPAQLFTAESFCLIQKLADLGMGRPRWCIFLNKKRAFRGRPYWCDEYDAEFKSCLTPAKIPRMARRRQMSGS